VCDGAGEGGCSNILGDVADVGSGYVKGIGVPKGLRMDGSTKPGILSVAMMASCSMPDV
jgi:hypothetical protein